MEYHAAERKKKLLPFMIAWINLESVMLSEKSQVVKDKYRMISPVSGTQSTKQISKQNITRDIEVKSNLTIARGEGGGDCGKKGFQEQLQRTHGENQGGRLGAGEGGGFG